MPGTWKALHKCLQNLIICSASVHPAARWGWVCVGGGGGREGWLRARVVGGHRQGAPWGSSGRTLGRGYNADERRASGARRGGRPPLLLLRRPLLPPPRASPPPAPPPPPGAAAAGRGREGGASGGGGSRPPRGSWAGAEIPARPGRNPRREQTRDWGRGGRGQAGAWIRSRDPPLVPTAASRPTESAAEGKGKLSPLPVAPGLPSRTPYPLRPTPFPAARHPPSETASPASPRFRLSLAQPPLLVRPTGSFGKRAGVFAWPLLGGGGGGAGVRGSARRSQRVSPAWGEGCTMAGGPGTILPHLSVTVLGRRGAGPYFQNE